MKTITQTYNPTYTFQSAGTLTARYHDGRTRRAFLVLVRNETKAVTYSVLVPTDGRTAPSCSCPGWRYHDHCKRSGCVHVAYALSLLLKEQEQGIAARIEAQLARRDEEEAREWGLEAPAPAETEETVKAEKERARQERLRRAEEDRRTLWPE